VVGYLLGDPSIPYIARAQLGALAACRRSGYHLLVEAVDLAAPDLTAELESLFATLSVDGVLLTPPHCDNRAILDALDFAGVPYARISPGAEPMRSPHVEADDRRAARDMTGHLIGLGHRDIGFIAGHPGHSAAARRLQGYREALQEHGLPWRQDRVASGDFTFASGLAGAERLLALEPRPTAIFAANDDMAAGALAAAQARGLKVPAELSLAGFDDSPIAAMVWPRLTTVRQPIADMAAAATEMLIAGASKGGRADGPVQQLLHCELIVRESTAPPRRL
jgi:LacI family transcriptional regulator